MSEIFKRLFRIAQTYIPKKPQILNNEPDNEFKTGSFEDTYSDESTYNNFTSDTKTNTSYPDFPSQVVEDLANFNLVPPSSLEEVRKARNREIKKYHPDRHMNDPKNRETAKEILQIYNASYARLKKFYKQK